MPLASIALLGLSIYGNFFPIAFSPTIGPIFVLACMAGGFAYAAVRVRAGRRATVAGARAGAPQPAAVRVEEAVGGERR